MRESSLKFLRHEIPIKSGNVTATFDAAFSFWDFVVQNLFRADTLALSLWWGSEARQAQEVK